MHALAHLSSDWYWEQDQNLRFTRVEVNSDAISEKQLARLLIGKVRWDTGIETEGGWMADINGDGKPDLALAHYGRSGVVWVDFAGPEPKVHKAGGHDEDGGLLGHAASVATEPASAPILGAVEQQPRWGVV